jgi:CBS domain-containing protein
MNTIKVGDVYQLHGKASMVVTEDAALDYVVALLGHERHLQGVFIVDSNQRFIGMVSSLDLLRWIQLQLYGGKQGRERQISELINLMKARKAKDILKHNNALFNVKENDTLQAALDLMIEYDQDIIVVLDSGGRIIGDLSLSESLLKVLEVGT